MKSKSRVFAVTGMGKRHGEGAAAGTPSPPKKRRERKSIVDSPNARSAVVNVAAQVYLRFKSPINGELVDRKKQWDRHIKVSLAKETAKASGESEPIADLEGWVGRISTFLTNQWFLKPQEREAPSGRDARARNHVRRSKAAPNCRQVRVLSQQLREHGASLPSSFPLFFSFCFCFSLLFSAFLFFSFGFLSVFFRFSSGFLSVFFPFLPFSSGWKAKKNTGKI